MVAREAVAVRPPDATKGGPTYTDSEPAAHEGQGSDLRARPGGVLLDYLRVRLVDDAETWDGLDRFLGERTVRPVGWQHGWYDRSADVLDGGIVAWCSDRDRADVQGVLVDLPGRACACLGDRLVPFLRWCLDRGRVARADYAIDDTEGRLTLDRIEDGNASGGLVTRWRRFKVIRDYEVGCGDPDGWTVYLGSRSSEAMVRIYDKAGERRRRGASVPTGTVWVRLELETKGDLADALARECLDKGASAVVGQIARRIRFAVPCETDSNRRRWAMAGWWQAFIGSVAAGPSLVAGEVPECTVDRLAAWVERQAGPALATVVAAAGGDLGRVIGILDRSRHRLRSKHRAALALAGVS